MYVDISKSSPSIPLQMTELIPGIRTLAPQTMPRNSSHSTNTLKKFLEYLKDKTPPYDIKEAAITIYGKLNNITRNRLNSNVQRWYKLGLIKYSWKDFAKLKRKLKTLYSSGNTLNAPLQIPITNELKTTISPALTMIQDFYRLTPDSQRKVINFITTID